VRGASPTVLRILSYEWFARFVNGVTGIP
jgi:hypothetical protein